MASSRKNFDSIHCVLLLVAAASMALPGCNVIDAVRGNHADLTDMVPGGNISTGEIDCWLTLTFESYPEGVDPRDVRVRFTSVALAQPAEFDWNFIASHDRVARGNDFGNGYQANEATVAHEPPPLGQPLKVRFPLNAKPKIANAPSTLWLKAELYWGDEAQDDTKKTLNHVYASRRGAFF